jgi:hypothetical protein
MSARCYLSQVIANVTKSDELPKIEDGNAIAQTHHQRHMVFNQQDCSGFTSSSRDSSTFSSWAIAGKLSCSVSGKASFR